MNYNYQKALEKVKKAKKDYNNITYCYINPYLNIKRMLLGPTGPKGDKGDIGPTGPQGIQGIEGKIGPQGERGPQGEQGIQGIQGIPGITGPMGLKGDKGDTGDTGPTGPAGTPGTSVRILGSYNNLSELLKEHPTGSFGDGYLVNSDLYVWSNNGVSWKNVGNIKGPKGEKGDIGPTGPQGERGLQGDIGPMGMQGVQGLQGPMGEQGIQGVPGPQGERGLQGLRGPAGPSIISSAHFVTFNDTLTPGKVVEVNNRLPIDLKVHDIKYEYNLNEDNTITFTQRGVYYIDFIVSANINNDNNNSQNNVIAVGFKNVKDTDIISGCSAWDNNANQVILNGKGFIWINTPNENFELVNLSKKTLYLTGPDIRDLNSESFYANPVVSLVIMKVEEI